MDCIRSHKYLFCLYIYMYIWIANLCICMPYCAAYCFYGRGARWSRRPSHFTLVLAVTELRVTSFFEMDDELYPVRLKRVKWILFITSKNHVTRLGDAWTCAQNIGYSLPFLSNRARWLPARSSVTAGGGGLNCTTFCCTILKGALAFPLVAPFDLHVRDTRWSQK